jgi:hypothetical protein
VLDFKNYYVYIRLVERKLTNVEKGMNFGLYCIWKGPVWSEITLELFVVTFLFEYFCQFPSAPPVLNFRSLFAIFAGLLRRQIFNSSLHNTVRCFPNLLGSPSSSSSSQLPCHYSLSTSVILHAYCVSITFQHIVFHSFKNLLCYSHFYSDYCISYFL